MSFHFKQFSITQQNEGLKVNTDGCLLGALSDYPNPINCLDIGTGTGVIALMLAQKYPDAEITAIELNEAAFKQAQKNIDDSIFRNRVQLINGDFLSHSFFSKFDLIVCNPPYFTKHLQGPDQHKNMALHSDTLPPESLLDKVLELLSYNGLFMVIYPPREMELFEVIATKNNLFSTLKYTIENKAGKHYRTIAGFSKAEENTTETTIVLMDNEGKRTAQFSEIMDAFYL